MRTREDDIDERALRHQGWTIAAIGRVVGHPGQTHQPALVTFLNEPEVEALLSVPEQDRRAGRRVRSVRSGDGRVRDPVAPGRTGVVAFFRVGAMCRVASSSISACMIMSSNRRVR
jgi:hypothetical protein